MADPMPSKRDPRPALLIIDMMNRFDFEGGDSLARGALAVVEGILELRRRYDDAGLPVIYINDNWMHWRGEFSDLVARCRKGSAASSEIATRLAPGPGHYHVLKPRQSAFLCSALPVLLEQLRIDSITLCGVATDACILATAIDAHMREYRTWVPEDGTAAISTERHQAALKLMALNTSSVTDTIRRSRTCFPGVDTPR